MEVDVSTLDALIRQYGTLDLCKIDVEGYEPEVLRGLSSSIPLVTFEYHLDEIEKLLDCVSYLARRGDIIINVNPMYSGDLVLSDWVDAQEFARLAKTGALPDTADCGVRTAAATR
ncbi:hypothetical protein GGQ80_001451 [Sphingomonas jinjuensis]|uniref:Methyltransferase FkbM domain-containing protein n=1 Tax=Sphingomonas jinjuensis TaxID=535907 RepID=A0A840F755_9SPHN|nr:FkbM family methyltransferase [Sphingomonas jinjuensis]MBB4153549.1 hypothetical protein [Sphingomonas jinjuensis]